LIGVAAGRTWDGHHSRDYAGLRRQPARRAAWRALLDHLVFADDAGQATHLPDHARGIMGAISPEMRRDLHRMIATVLQSK